ncbi:peptidyl-tRNA hydrolase II [Tilletiaria anomala UBC 951]|uniref:peptidyl-tRNA hydrolase n=1 Tax=Tilletiaria anomala (strain ATCC 24038 / CBS 436.72 / UBC 951) TaxID=1037660 RepID=A0A066V3G0_TILAU|nr:peptidyl-tRNA hydrolase II [Tilletiaria anomala UBC 951]KDN35976.1 peptidyl-tRNA hydrolase II [Tilletiaria anomala UBC 951]
MTSTSRAAPPLSVGADSSEMQTPLVMQLIVDRNLASSPDWGVGPLMAQAAHAAMAVATKTAAHPLTQEYVSAPHLIHMHKVVLQSPEKQSLQELSARLKASHDTLEGLEKERFPDHFLWIEQPENIPTVLAIAPNRKPQALKKILNKCSLLRG